MNPDTHAVAPVHPIPPHYYHSVSISGNGSNWFHHSVSERQHTCPYSATVPTMVGVGVEITTKEVVEGTGATVVGEAGTED